MSRKKIEILFLCSIMAMALAIIGQSMKYAIKSFLLPLLVGIPILTLMLIQIVKESRSGKEHPNDSSATAKKDEANRGILTASTALLCFILLIYLVGFLIAIPLGTFVYIVIQGENKPLAFCLGLVMFLVVFILSRFLGLYLYEGILFL